MPLFRRHLSKALFSERLADMEAFVAEQPVPRDDLLEKLSLLEVIGNQTIGAGEQKPIDFAKAMHQVYGEVVELHVEPPFTKDQSNQLKGRFAVFAAMTERAEPQMGHRDKSEPTNTLEIPTDNRK